jgi:hypothetical protein
VALNITMPLAPPRQFSPQALVSLLVILKGLK